MNKILSPYYNNGYANEVDDFEEKVHAFKDKPFAVTVAFDSNPKENSTSFEIATRAFETEEETIASLLYVYGQIAKKLGFQITVKAIPLSQPQNGVDINNLVEEIKKIFPKNI